MRLIYDLKHDLSRSNFFSLSVQNRDWEKMNKINTLIPIFKHFTRTKAIKTKFVQRTHQHQSSKIFVQVLRVKALHFKFFLLIAISTVFFDETLMLNFSKLYKKHDGKHVLFGFIMIINKPGKIFLLLLFVERSFMYSYLYIRNDLPSRCPNIWIDS